MPRAGTSNGYLFLDATQTGTATLDASGYLAAYWKSEFTGTAPELIDGMVRDALGDLIPGGRLEHITWKGAEADDVPVVRLEATVRGEGLIDGSPSRYSLVVPGIPRTPEPRALADRELPVPASSAVSSCTVGGSNRTRSKPFAS